MQRYVAGFQAVYSGYCAKHSNPFVLRAGAIVVCFLARLRSSRERRCTCRRRRFRAKRRGKKQTRKDSQKEGERRKEEAMQICFVSNLGFELVYFTANQLTIAGFEVNLEICYVSVSMDEFLI